MFDPNEQGERCEAYLECFLNGRVSFLRAELLKKSTREAPWRLDVKVNGKFRSYVLRLDSRRIEHEYRVLKAMERVSIPTPRVYGWDPGGDALGIPCFFADFIEGESLLGPMLADEAWAEALYLDTVCALHALTKEDLPEVAQYLERETAADVLENACEYFQENPHPLAAATYIELKERMPELPEVRFSNGDLWLDNFLVRDKKLAGVIDFTNSGFSDPIFEFLLSFFVCPQLRDRGVEQRYCLRLGVDPEILHWYHGLEYFDTWRWVLSSGESFEQHTEESLERDLYNWLDEIRVHK